MVTECVDASSRGTDTSLTDLLQKGSGLPLGSVKSFRLSSLLVVLLLGVIAVMLIAPDVDLPDTAFQGNTAPIAVHFVSHHVPQGNGDSQAFKIQPGFDDLSSLSLRTHSNDSGMIVPVASRRILRC